MAELVDLQHDGERRTCAIFSDCQYLSRVSAARNGDVTFTDIRIGKASSMYVFVFKLANNPYVNVTSAAFAVVHNDAFLLSTSAPGFEWNNKQVVIAGREFALSATLEDGYGNPVLCCCSRESSIGVVAPHSVLATREECVAELVRPADASVRLFGEGSVDGVTFRSFDRGLVHFDLTMTLASIDNILQVCVANGTECDPVFSVNTTLFEVVHGSESQLAVVAPDFELQNTSAVLEITGDLGTSAIVAGTSWVYITIELQDAFANRVFDVSQQVGFEDEVYSKSFPGAELFFMIRGDTELFETDASMLRCNVSTSRGCLTATSTDYQLISDSNVVTECPQSDFGVNLTDGRARLAFTMYKAGTNFVVEVCTSSELPCCGNTQTTNASATLCGPGRAEMGIICGLNKASTRPFSVLPGVIEDLVTIWCTANRTGGPQLGVGAEISCTLALVDRFGNAALASQTSSSYTYTIEYEGTSIAGLPTSVTPSDGFLVLTVPANSSTFVSPLDSPATEVQLRYTVDVLNPAFSVTFDIVHGPPGNLRLTNDVGDTPVNRLLNLRGVAESGGRVMITVVDKFGNVAETFTELFEVLVSGRDLSPSPVRPVSNESSSGWIPSSRCSSCLSATHRP
eukprot:933858-Rhodomonas_salina.1